MIAIPRRLLVLIASLLGRVHILQRFALYFNTRVG